MPRNLERRVEIMFPVEDEKLKERVINILDLQFEDNVKKHELMPDESYSKKKVSGRKRYSCQEDFCERAEEMAKAVRNDVKESRVFIPLVNPAQDKEIEDEI